MGKRVAIVYDHEARRKDAFYLGHGPGMYCTSRRFYLQLEWESIAHTNEF
jgi:hypothetical protein